MNQTEARIDRAWKMVLRHKSMGNVNAMLTWLNVWVDLVNEFLPELHVDISARNSNADLT